MLDLIERSKTTPHKPISTDSLLLLSGAMTNITYASAIAAANAIYNAFVLGSSATSEADRAAACKQLSDDRETLTAMYESLCNLILSLEGQYKARLGGGGND